MRRNTVISATAFFTAAIVYLPLFVFAANPRPIRIGVPSSYIRGEKKAEFGAAVKELLLSKVESHTGVDCELELTLGIGDMRKKLRDGRLHFGLCHGFEFAWMQDKDPELRALMLAIPDHQPLKAFVVVAPDSPVKSLCDLNGKTIAVPKAADAFVRLFIDRDCRCGEKALVSYAREVTKPVNAETALHDLFDDKVQAAVVDGAELRAFGERYPARAKLLRNVVESQTFPLSVIAYREGALDDSVVRHFQERLEKAQANPMGRQLMALLHTRGFEPVPDDHPKQLVEFLKRYPPEKGLFK